MITIKAAEQMIRELYKQYLVDRNDYKLKIAVLKIVTDNKELYESFKKYYTSGALDQFLPKSLKFVGGSSVFGEASFFQQQVEMVKKFRGDPRTVAIMDDFKNRRIDEATARIRLMAVQQQIAFEILKDFSNKRGLKDLLFMPYDLMKTAIVSHFDATKATVSKVIDRGSEAVATVYTDVKEGVGEVFSFAKWIVPVALVVAGVVAVKVLKD